jgi:hypothetical protein
VFFDVSPAFSIRDIDRGIVFLMAEWSGPAQWAWRQLCDFVDGYPGAKPNVIKVEWQDPGPVYSRPELEGKVHGLGKAMVVKDGQIVFSPFLAKKRRRFRAGVRIF